jgi:hypothetical protein
VGDDVAAEGVDGSGAAKDCLHGAKLFFAALNVSLIGV